MSRTSLHRPRRYRAVSDRPATGTRLFPCPFPPTTPPTLPPLQALPKGPIAYASAAINHRPAPCRLWKVPGQKPACPFQGPLPSARPTHPAHPFRLLRRRPGAQRHVAPSGHSAPSGLPRPRPCRPVRTVGPPPTQNQRTIFGFHRRHHRRTSGLRTPVTGPRSHPLGWSSTSGGRDCPTREIPSRVSSTSSQKHGAVAEPAPMWNIRCRGQRPSVQASPSSCATVRDLPSPPPPRPPQSREKRTLPAKQSDLTPGSAHQSKLPHSYPPKGPPNSPYPQPLPPQLNNRRP